MNQVQKRVVDRPLRLQDFPRNKENMFLVSVKSLRGLGFKNCVVSEACICGGRPCKGAVVIDPTKHKTKIMVCCAIWGDEIPADIAAYCKNQE